MASDGGVFSFGDTQFYGSMPGLGFNPAGSGKPHSLNAPIVGMVPSHDDGGYFMVASDGGVFAFGDATFAGSCPGIGGCSGAAVAVVPDASGGGYWVVTTTGSVYAFGDADNYGAPGPQSSPISSAVATPDGGGYWILEANGQVFPYGDAGGPGQPAARFRRRPRPGGLDLLHPDGGGYWVVTALGQGVQLRRRPFDGDMSGTHLAGPDHRRLGVLTRFGPAQPARRTSVMASSGQETTHSPHDRQSSRLGVYAVCPRCARTRALPRRPSRAKSTRVDPADLEDVVRADDDAVPLPFAASVVDDRSRGSGGGAAAFARTLGVPGGAALLF